MIFFTIGLPGRFAEWCEGVMARLAASLGGPVSVEGWPSTEEVLGYRPFARVMDRVALSLIRDAPAHLVVGARQPDEPLRQALVKTGMPFVLAVDDPRIAVADIVAKTGIDAASATRVVANSCPFVMHCTMIPGAMRLHAAEASLDRVGTVMAIASHLRVPIEREHAVWIGDELTKSGLTPGPAAALDDSSLFDERTRKMLDGALSSYAARFAGSAMHPLIWTRDLFSVSGDPLQRPIKPLDVSGGARCLIYGPYIHLAPGPWSARVVLGFSQEAVGHAFLVDACSGDRQLASVGIQPEMAGVHTAEITFFVDEVAGCGIEIRVMVIGEQAKGWLAFGQATLMPLELSQTDATGQSADDFAAVLGL